MRVPASMRSLSPMRTMSPVRSISPRLRGRSLTLSVDDAASITTTQEGDDLNTQRFEVQCLESECAKLANEVEALTVARKLAEARAMQDLQMAHEVQLDEIEHFRRLVDEKRAGAEVVSGSPVSGASNRVQPPNTGALLEAELEQLQQHLAQVTQKGDEERKASEALANELRRETREIVRELEAIAEEKAACVRDLEEARSAHGSAVPASVLDNERQEGESIVKEIARTRTRIGGLELKIQQLQQEAKDIGERASFVLRSVPDACGQDAHPAESARAIELNSLVQERERRLEEAKRLEASLRKESDEVDQALQAAKVEAAVMEQKMTLLKNRTAPPKTT